MKIIRPSVIIGLGEYGSKAVKIINSERIKGRTDIFNPLIKTISIDANKTFQINEQIFHLENLAVSYNEFTPDFFVSNKKCFISISEKLKFEFENLLNDIQSVEHQPSLLNHGYERGEPEIILISSAFDPVGSSIILPLVETLQKVHWKFRLSMILILPDLSFEKDLNIRKLEHARAFTFLTELDADLNTRENVYGIFLIDSKNEGNNTLNSFDVCLSVLPDFVNHLIFDKVFTSTDYTDITGLPIQDSNKYAHYSSFGYSRLVYPHEEIFNLTNLSVRHRLLSEILASIEIRMTGDNKFSRELIGSDVKTFIKYNNIDKIVKRVSSNGERDSLFTTFSPGGIVGDGNIPAEIFFDALDKATDHYDLDTFRQIKMDLEENRKIILQEHTGLIFDFLREKNEEKRDEITPYTESFFSYLGGNDSLYLSDEEINTEILNMQSVSESVMEFYREKLGLKSAERKLQSLNQDLKNKVGLLKDLKAKSDVEPNIIEECANDIQQLTTEKEELEKAIRDIEVKMMDSSVKKNLILQDKDKFLEQESSTKERIQTKENIIREKEIELSELKEKSKKVFRRLLIIYPLIIALCVIAFFIASGILSSFWETPFNIPISPIYFWIIFTTVCAFVYFIWATIIYNKKVSAPLKFLITELKSMRSERIHMMHNLINVINERYKNEFEHRVHDIASKCLTDMNNWIDNVTGLLRTFIDNIKSQVETDNEYIAGHSFELYEFNNKAIVDSEYCASIMQEKILDAQLFFSRPLELADRATKIGGVPLINYMIKSIKGNQSILENLVSDMDKYNEILYSFIHDKTIYEVMFVGENKRSDSQIEADFKYLLNSSSPWIKISAENINDESVYYSNLYLDLANKKLDQSVRKIMESLSNGDTQYHDGSQYEISHMGLRVGFPAFTISQIQYYEEELKFLCNDEKREDPYKRESFYTNPANSKYSLFPAYFSGGKSMIAYDIASLAIGLSILKKEDKKYKYKKYSWDTYTDLCGFLQTEEGGNVFDELKDILEEVKLKAYNDQEYAKELISVLREYLKTRHGSDSQQEVVIQEFISSISSF